MSEWQVNGRPADRLSIDDRAIHYGDGVFETIAVRDAAPRLLPLHLARLGLGCDALGIDCPTSQQLQQELLAAIGASSIDTGNCVAKLIVSAGSGRRGYRRTGAAASTIIGIFAGNPLPRDLYESGVNVIRCRTQLALQPRLAGIKSLNRLEQVLARAEWTDGDIFEGLMCDTDERLICGTMSNVFVLHESSLVTPALSRCGVAGVMRQQILTLFEDAGTKIDIRDITMGELDGSGEVFLCNSQYGAVPVRRIADRQLSIGAATRTVMSLLAGSGIEECTI